MFKRVLLVVLALFVSIAFADIQVEITSPTAGQVFSPCGEITLTSNITITGDEEIKDVRYYSDGRQIAYSRKDPWEAVYKNAVRGAYEVVAKVTDKNKNEYFSEPVAFKVGSVSAGEKIRNGGFDCGTTNSWTTTFHQGAVANYNVYDDSYFDTGDYLVIEVVEAGTADWHIQLNQSCPVDSGHSYEISFWADADDARDITVGMQENQDPYASQLWQTVSLEGFDQYIVEFEATRTDPTNQLRINVGGNSTTTYFDEFMVIDRSHTGVKERMLDWNGQVLNEFELLQAYPNPFNMETTIRFAVSQPSHVDLTIYDVNGRLVKTLANQEFSAGHHSLKWNGLNNNNVIVPSGVYFYKMDAVNASQHSSFTRKIVLVK